MGDNIDPSIGLFVFTGESMRRGGKRKKYSSVGKHTPLSRALNSTMAARDIEKLPPPRPIPIRSALKNENSCTLRLSDYFEGDYNADNGYLVSLRL